MEIEFNAKMVELMDALVIRSKEKFLSSRLDGYIYFDSVANAYGYVALSGKYDDLSHYEVYFVIEKLFDSGILHLTPTIEKSERGDIKNDE